MSILCRLGRHRRSARLARIEGAHVRSACARCGTPLIRLAPRTWLPIDPRLAAMLD